MIAYFSCFVNIIRRLKLSKKTSVFGVNINNITMSDAINFSKKILYGKEDRQIAIFTPNLEMIEAARRSPFRKKLLNSADILLPDGTGVALIAKIFGSPLTETVPGINFGEGLFREIKKERTPVFLLGGKPGVAEKAARNIRSRFAPINVCGYHHGYFSQSKDAPAVIDKINASRAEILIVCMGFPAQEHFVAKYRRELSGVKLLICLGGSIDVWAGDVPRAPKIFQDVRAEWLWRIVIQPDRAPRFASSLPAIPAAISASLKNISPDVLKSLRRTYNVTEKN